MKVTQGGEGFHLWQWMQFSDVDGFDLIYNKESQDVYNPCSEPFIHVSDDCFALDLEETISTSPGYDLLILPHPNWYLDQSWEYPVPVAASWEADWWPSPLRILFRYGPKGISKFHKGEPFARAIPVQKQSVNISLPSEYAESAKKFAESYIEENRDKYVTRKWVTSNGVMFDNVYNVLCHLRRSKGLPLCLEPPTKKKYRILGGNSVKMVQNQTKST
jgi:hypothetical protein